MLLILLRVALALTFATAAAAKLGDLSAFRRATVDLGVPKRAVPIVALAVPVAEMAVALGLFPGVSGFAASIIGIGLTVAFTVLLSVNLSRGNRPACNCFGAASHDPIGPWSVVRNAALIAGFAIVAAKDPGTGVGQSFSSLVLRHASASTGVVILAAVGVTQVFVVLQLILRRRTAVAEAPEPASYGLPVGAVAPTFVLPDLEGREVALDDLRERALPVLLVFIDPDCAPCTALLPELADWRTSFDASLSMAIVSRGTVAENRVKMASLEISPVLLQEAGELALAYNAVATPSAVLISPRGRIQGTAAGAHAIRHLVDAVVETPADAAGLAPLPPGTEAPLFEVPLAGAVDDSVTLLSRRGRMTVLVFWSTSCTFCVQMAARLRAWEQSLDPESGPHLVVLSDRTPSRRDTPFTHVGIDEGTLLRRAYGVDRTPLAFLIDAEGRITQSAIGADQVMAIAQRAVTLSAVAQRLSTRFRPIAVSADPPMADVPDRPVPDAT